MIKFFCRVGKKGLFAHRVSQMLEVGVQRNHLHTLRLLILLIIFVPSCRYFKPSDEELRKQFYENKDTIMLLKKMQLADSNIVRIAPTFTRLENDWSWPRKEIGFSKERWDKYRDLFKKVNIKDGLQKEGSYIFYLVDGWTGFVFTTETPKQQVRKNSKECIFKKNSDVCYVPLEKNWYLFIG